MPSCLVLHATSAYAAGHDGLLREILLSQPGLVAVVGLHCEAWEEALDMLGARMAADGQISAAQCHSTSHPCETLSQAVSFAQQWCRLHDWPVDVHVLRV